MALLATVQHLQGMKADDQRSDASESTAPGCQSDTPSSPETHKHAHQMVKCKPRERFPGTFDSESVHSPMSSTASLSADCSTAGSATIVMEASDSLRSPPPPAPEYPAPAVAEAGLPPAPPLPPALSLPPAPSLPPAVPDLPPRLLVVGLPHSPPPAPTAPPKLVGLEDAVEAACRASQPMPPAWLRMAAPPPATAPHLPGGPPHLDASQRQKPRGFGRDAMGLPPFQTAGPDARDGYPATRPPPAAAYPGAAYPPAPAHALADIDDVLATLAGLRSARPVPPLPPGGCYGRLRISSVLVEGLGAEAARAAADAATAIGEQPVKVVLPWFVHPTGRGITDQTQPAKVAIWAK